MCGCAWVRVGACVRVWEPYLTVDRHLCRSNKRGARCAQLSKRALSVLCFCTDFGFLVDARTDARTDTIDVRGVCPCAVGLEVGRVGSDEILVADESASFKPPPGAKRRVDVECKNARLAVLDSRVVEANPERSVPAVGATRV